MNTENKPDQQPVQPPPAQPQKQPAKDSISLAEKLFLLLLVKKHVRED
jgi:hypothetical protein